MKEFATITKNEIEMGFENAELRDYEDKIRNAKTTDPEYIDAMSDMPIYE
jgi:hypothetical protein